MPLVWASDILNRLTRMGKASMSHNNRYKSNMYLSATRRTRYMLDILKRRSIRIQLLSLLINYTKNWKGEIAIFVPILLSEAYFDPSTFKTSRLDPKQFICGSILSISIN